MSYNGHKNYETWLIHVYEIPQAIATDYMECAVKVKRITAGYCEDWYEQMYQNELSYKNLPGPMKDMLTAAEKEIDWHAIAESTQELVEDLVAQEEQKKARCNA